MAKIVQTEGRTSSLLECYAEVQPIFCKDTKKIETTIPFNSIFLFSTQRLSIREPPNYLPTEATEPTEVSGARYSPTDCTDIHRLGGYGILPYPRSHQTIFPQNPTQPHHLCVSVRICGRLFSARSFCVFCEIRGRTCANKLGTGSVEGIHETQKQQVGNILPQITQIFTDVLSGGAAVPAAPTKQTI